LKFITKAVLFLTVLNGSVLLFKAIGVVDWSRRS